MIRQTAGAKINLEKAPSDLAMTPTTTKRESATTAVNPATF
jgi:hypothetical protein